MKYDSVKILREVTSGFINRLQGGWEIEMGKNPKGTLISIIQLGTCSPLLSSSTVWLLISVFVDVKLKLLSFDTDAHFLQLQ